VKKALILVALIAVVSIIAFADNVPEGKEVLTFETKMGTVTFKHQEHQSRVGEGCVSCHHAVEGEDEPRGCSECHMSKPAEGDETPKLKDAVHNTCHGCHQELADEGKATGPLKKKCKECHIKAAK